MGRRPKVDKDRASRDGHEFHEAWVARKATQLLWPESDLTAIAVEGLSPADQAGASAATVEIADLTFYFGGKPTFKNATRTTVAQVKYSIASENKDFRAFNAKKTVQKFGKTYRTFKRKYGAQAVQEKLDFQLITNQPIADALLQAIEAIAEGLDCKGETKEQARQFKAAAGLTGKPLADFARKLKIFGRSGSLPQTKRELASLLVDWSATNNDSLATARLGELRNLVRDKAGHKGTNHNLIRRTDVLAALQIGDPDELLPCKPALIDVEKILERTQLRDAASCVAGMSAPLLIHATGGVGKTVFMGALASKIATDHEIVFFDCFGGGAYRSPEDARHLPNRGLIHISNTLAFRGLCDPILPGSHELHTLLRTFRRRLKQCLDTISRMTPDRKLAIFIDAIDNAAFAAGQASEDCFPIKLLEGLGSKPIDAVKLIVSCRTERRPKILAKVDEFELRPFTKEETTAFLRTRLRRISATEIDVAQARSGGNPRVLEYLLNSDRGLLDPSEIDREIELDDLIQQRIKGALSLAMEKGYKEEDLRAFLAGLAVLPPPVPIDEYAAAHGMETAAIESFASDLSPLLERTNHGLMFRDEPTETLVHNKYAKTRDALKRVASNLLARQDTSVFAARSLPRLLHELDESEQLFALAFDDRVPASITSTVGKRNVRYARLKVATLHAAMKTDYNSLVRLLVELSTISAVDQRGADYLLAHPDLAVAARDVDARRRLFEIRTAWPGTRHARLSIVNSLAGEHEEAGRHALANEEWIRHYHRNSRRNDFDRDYRPDRVDIAARIFFLLSQGRTENAARYLAGWQDWYAFEIADHVIGYCQLARILKTQSARQMDDFFNSLSGIGALAAALSFHELPNLERKVLSVKLASLCKRKTKLHLPQRFSHPQTYELEDGLRKSAAISLSLGLTTEALTISLRARHDRPGVWAYRDGFNHGEVFAYIFRVALRAAAKKQPIHEKDLLPRELITICSGITKATTGRNFLKRARQKLEKVPRKSRYEDENAKPIPPDAISHDQHQVLERFLSIRLEPLLEFTRALSATLAATSQTIDARFVELVEAWEKVRKNRDNYRIEVIDRFFHLLGMEAVLFILWVRQELKSKPIERMLVAFHDHMAYASNLVRIIGILAQREPLHSIAGEQAIKARAMIEYEDEVTQRAFLFGDLGRAMLPASLDEAAVYFRDGLEQLDAIGSGDYLFTNELLLFASEMKGEEIDEGDFHTLSNICELNMVENPEKFAWGAYGRGMAKAAGIRGLAKLSRWDDRDKVTLKYTLLPYLIGLLEAGKIDPKDALCVNRLANPVEYFHASTKEFAEALRNAAGPDPEVISELITQFEDDNPTIAGDDTVQTLCALANESLGSSHELTRHLSKSRHRYETAWRGRESKYSNPSDDEPKLRNEADKREKENRAALTRIAAATDPTNEASLVKAIDDFNELGNMYDLKDSFFSALRRKVPYAERAQYIQNIANLENLFFHWKLAELKATKEAWVGSTAALPDVYKHLAGPLVRLHAGDLIDHDSFSGSAINEIAQFTGLSRAALVLELIRFFSRPDSTIAGSIWLAFATSICAQADKGQGQLALNRLLSSESARLSDNVVDGAWKTGCYPSDDFVEIAAGLIWRMLGSSHAVDRWRAAHCIRRFARFGRWDIVDKIATLFGKTKAGAFQAPELVFYFLHARLWLLIALARIALDHPAKVARYKEELLAVVADKDNPHVLMRHFASQALTACMDRSKLTLDANTLEIVRNADKSPHARLSKKGRNGGGFYQGRPESAPEPSFKFGLEYDFNKYDVDRLGRVFGKGCWEVDDLISEVVLKIDPLATDMYDNGGRAPRERQSLEMATSFHRYGEQLGWHALFIAAGKLLAHHPVVTDDWWYEDDPWGEWLSQYGLTREDGMWLSDGTDWTPYDAEVTLLESTKKGFAITGDQQKIVQLAGLNMEMVIGKELVIEGSWHSSDGIEIELSSALVPPRKVVQLARKLIREKPILAWVPVFQGSEEDDDHLTSDKKEYSPWIVSSSGEARLDKHDPYGVTGASFRSRLAQEYSKVCKLKREDEFGRFWRTNRGTISVRAEAWGRNKSNREAGPYPGSRLWCRSSALKKILTKYDKELLLLFQLQRYEKETYQSDAHYSHSIGVIRIDKSLNVKYFKGRVNYPNKRDW